MLLVFIAVAATAATAANHSERDSLLTLFVLVLFFARTWVYVCA